jgi:hypothetical protein
MAPIPPSCPCPRFPSHWPGFDFTWRCDGSYRRPSDGERIQRYLCTAHDRRFSTQTFRPHHRLQHRDVSERLVPLLVSKVTHRQASRLLGVDRKEVLQRVTLIGAIARSVHGALVPHKPLELASELVPKLRPLRSSSRTGA